MRQLPSGDVTFMFTDVEGSTQLFHDLAEAYPELQANALATVARAIEGFEGLVLRTDGDGQFAVFTAAPAAVAAAAEAQRSLARTSALSAIKVRMGVHTGAASPVGDSYVSLAVHLAARVSAAANGGQVLLSDATAVLVRHALPAGSTLQDMGRFRLRGFPEPERLHELVLEELPRAPKPRASRQSGNLQPPVTSFVGRGRELAELEHALQQHRLVSVLGGGGIGKTRLAIEGASRVRDRYPGGVWFVALAARDDADAPIELLARAVGADPSGGLGAIVESLHEAPALVVLDNCEHLREQAASLAEELLASCPDVTVLATSREPLGVPGERLHWLVPLEVGEPTVGIADLPEAVALFVARADLVRSREWRGADLDAAFTICRELDGVPLAIELAAARTAVLTPSEVADRLERRFQLLTGNVSDATPHHRSLRATLDWSEALLNDQERAAFRRLSVFRGGFTLGAAARVLDDADPEEVLEIIASLVLKSLLVHDEPSHGSRYFMLESVRQYAHELLASGRDLDATRRAHADWYVDLAEAAEPRLRGRDQVVWLDRLESEHENLRAALENLASIDARRHLRLALSLRRFWLVRGLWQMGQCEFARALADPSLDGRERAWAAAALADLEMSQGAYRDAQARLDEALAIADSVQDDELASEVLLLLASLADRQRASNSVELLHASRDAALRCGRRDLAAEAAAAAGAALAIAGDVTGRDELEWAQRVAREDGDVRLLAFTLNRLGLVERTAGELDAARAHLVEAVSMTRAIGDRNAEAGCLFHLAALVESADPAEAERMLERAVSLASALNDHEGVAVASVQLGRLRAGRGDVASARSLLVAAEGTLRELNREPDAAAAAALLQALDATAQSTSPS